MTLEKIAEIQYDPSNQKVKIKMYHNEKTFGYWDMREIYRKIKRDIDNKLNEVNNALKKTL